MIATSPLTGRIFSGRVNKDRTAFIGKKQDVTSEVLKAIIEKAEFHNGTFEIQGGDRKWTVSIEQALKEKNSD